MGSDSTISYPKLNNVLYCPKCNSDNVFTRYHESQYGTGSKGCNATDFSRWDGEHLHHYCRECGYDWTSPVAS